jgi:hypothetical protein
LQPEYDEDTSPVEVVPLQLPSQLACDQTQDTQESDDKEEDVSSHAKSISYDICTYFIIIFIQEAKESDAGSVQTQENEFSFSQEEARTVAKELEEDIRKHEDEEWKINGGMKLVDTSPEELAIQNSLRTTTSLSFESPTQLYSVSTPNFIFKFHMK